MDKGLIVATLMSLALLYIFGSEECKKAIFEKPPACKYIGYND